MTAVYAHYENYADLQNDMEHCLSIGTLENPAVAHFKTQSDIIAYIYGNEPAIKDERLKQRHQFLHSEIIKQLGQV